MTLSCCGLGVATTRAIAIGPVFMLDRNPLRIAPRSIDPATVPGELQRLEDALAAAQGALRTVRDQIPHATPVKVAEFIDSHLLMLEDAALVDPARALIRERLFSAEWALEQHRMTLVKAFEDIEDPYLRGRRDDLDHVVQHILGFLLGERIPDSEEDTDLNGCVVIAHDISPADTVVLRQRRVAALVTEYGSPLSHTAILARSLNLPMVVGVRKVTSYFRPGETVVVDDESGVVLADVDADILAHYRQRIRVLDERRAHLRRLVREPSLSADGTPVSLLGNLELPEDTVAIRANGAAGVGLYRTEFLYMNRDRPPDEEEHLAAYLEVIRGLEGTPVTIRTLDLGADKQVDGDSATCPLACNPALGLRAIRLCLKQPELFRPQLRAILRASAFGPVRLMIPMLSHIRELDAVLALIEQVGRELDREGLAFDPHMPVGGMIEVPAAALSAPAFTHRLDFLSIGTNDLIQYTLAIDRMDDTVSYLYDPLHPAILRLIRMTIEAGRAHGIPVSMCGEMAGTPRYVPLLLGLGLREFSMQPGSLLEIKERVRGSHIPHLERATGELFAHLDDHEPEQFAQAIERICS
ncbi:phosphoenolpyruvate--protein phosphotransferase [Candidatus Thiosymbion oneisti]|uniref:phosphoenolpyruvate--protein phosphotransferase n=1 Tax=Candidatus Thiosymbion oneisti TaxID=589554 RepID=UPI000B25EE73|nr:phosphoenolpyruvate--protein phosphotransferase [Candidatus Thiosymbion oneisti]